MQYIVPTSITDAMLVSSSVPETDYAAWSSATTYAVGNRVILASTHRRYESLIGSNLNRSPATDPAAWLDLGPTNRWAAFDRSVGTVTSQATSIVMVLTPGIVDSLALLDMDVESVTVQATISGTVIYSRTFNPVLSDVGITNWYSYFFDSIEKRRNIVLTDLPPYGDAVYTITLTNSASTAQIGSCILGRAHDLGQTQYGASLGIIDYSVKSTDAFGVTSVSQRAYAKRMNAVVAVPSESVDGSAKRLAQVRATPIVWVGADQYESTIIYGWVRDWAIEIRQPTVSFCSITIEGLT